MTYVKLPNYSVDWSKYMNVTKLPTNKHENVSSITVRVLKEQIWKHDLETHRHSILHISMFD